MYQVQPLPLVLIKHDISSLSSICLFSHQVQQALRGGCDYNCGRFYHDHLKAALNAGAVNNSDVDTAVSRMLKKAFQLGTCACPLSSRDESKQQ